MPIVFEEVTGEIVPEPRATESDRTEPPAPRDANVTETLRREICLLAERERRLRVD